MPDDAGAGGGGAGSDSVVKYLIQNTLFTLCFFFLCRHSCNLLHSADPCIVQVLLLAGYHRPACCRPAVYNIPRFFLLV